MDFTAESVSVLKSQTQKFPTIKKPRIAAFLLAGIEAGITRSLYQQWFALPQLTVVSDLFL